MPDDFACSSTILYFKNTTMVYGIDARRCRYSTTGSTVLPVLRSTIVRFYVYRATGGTGRDGRAWPVESSRTSAPREWKYGTLYLPLLPSQIESE